MQPEGEIFIIPARLDECDYHESLRRFHGVDLYEERGYEYLMRALRLRADKIGAVLQSKKGWLGSLAAPVSKQPAVKKPKPVPKKSAPAPSALPTQAPKPAEERMENKKLSVQVIVAIVGAVATILAAILGSLPWKEWFAPAPDVITTATSQVTVTSTPTIPPTFTPTPTPLPAEITDAKGIRMNLVPAGKFTMGAGEQSHEVYLDDFYMDIYEVTNAAYKACVEAGKCSLPKDTGKYNNSNYADHPVVYVDWNMSKTYCEWRGVRLPTEAEWEKAARGTDGRTYPWGEGIDCSKANYYDGNKYCVNDTSKVGSYESRKSPYGLYDMAGNVWEWTSSLYKDYPYVFDDGREYLNASGDRVLRGGSWGNGDNFTRSALRFGVTPDVTYISVGFRCARSQ